MPNDDATQPPARGSEEQTKSTPATWINRFRSLWAKSQPERRKLDPKLEQIQRLQEEVREAVELLEFAIKTGRTVDDGIVDRIKRAQQYLTAFDWPDDPARAEFEKTYRDLAVFMKPVTIETLRATRDGYSGKHRTFFTRRLKASDAKLFSRKLWAWVAFTALLVVVLQTVSEAWIVDEENAASLPAYILLFMKPLNPFFYGLFGALAYLLRSAHSFLADRTFDVKRIPEYYNRMLLGFISGGIVLLFISDPTKFGVGQGAVSFMVGYNTDYLFDMLERVANSIFPKVNLAVTPKDGAVGGKPGIAKVQIATKELQPGGQGNAMVTLTAPAPVEGVTVALTADNNIKLNQASVSVASGSTSAQFTFSIVATATTGQGSITATANGTSATDSVSIKAVGG